MTFSNHRLRLKNWPKTEETPPEENIDDEDEEFPMRMRMQVHQFLGHESRRNFTLKDDEELKYEGNFYEDESSIRTVK